MKKRTGAIMLVIVMLFSVCGCSTQETDPNGSGATPLGAQYERKLFIDSQETLYDESLVPSVPAYTIEADFSNVINYDDFSYVFENEEARQKLLENGFVVVAGYSDEFYNVYENNRYSLTPNFITVDSMMHTYHLYFSRLLKGIENEHFIPALTEISSLMQQASLSQYEALQGTEWENAAKRNVAFFSTGLALLQPQAEIPSGVQDVVSQELALIEDASQITASPVMNMGAEQTGMLPLEEDYSQYIPRGYYTTSDALTSYFKAMMWYGRLSFRQSDEDQSKSALLMTLAMGNDETAMSQWEKIYTVTGFFVGASDDPGIWEYGPAAEAAYGGLPQVSELPEKSDEWQRFLQLLSEMEPPAINSIPIYDEMIQTDRDEAIKAFRFMGQRTVLDASIFQQLVYRAVQENDEGGRRMLPSALDIPAALGSELAQEYLSDAGNDNYEGYAENMAEIQGYLADAPETLWNGTLYSSWLNTLRPLTEEKGEGYPTFMQNNAWTAKNLNSFLGSWTELKHDTILYAKQVYAEMGGGGIESKDDRGYVEPEPVVYARLVSLIAATVTGLENYGILGVEDAENLGLMQELASQLLTIAEKELKYEPLNDEEYELIRSFGGQLEHFWYQALQGEDGAFIEAADYPAAIVADVATDPNGRVLEVGTGRIDNIYVIADVEGSLRIACGGVFSFYEFEQPLSDRLTDEKWRAMLGIDLTFDEDSGLITDNSVDIPHPGWTSAFRVEGQW